MINLKGEFSYFQFSDMTRQHTRVTALAMVIFSISTIKSTFINKLATKKPCQLFLISGKFVLNRNESLIHDKNTVWYDQNDAFYPWYREVFLK